ncbi:MAG: methyltransferase domain-containing protein [Fibrobacteres bacterium]|nr:methyltransferase domain-containing protein [Fibrobacterota bacterium]
MNENWKSILDCVPNQIMADYLIGHRKRYEYLLEVVRKFSGGPSIEILDVGPSPFTRMLLWEYKRVQTLGFGAARDLFCQIPSDVPHHAFDLNDSEWVERWPVLPKFDMIVFAEVIEHLHVAPEHVLAFLSSCLKPGGTIICQTPNAVSLDKRIHMVAGTNPFEPIRQDSSNPGHFRESTRKELVRFGESAGLEVVFHQYRNYFISPRRSMRMIDRISAPFPSLRRGQTIVFRRP